MKDVHVVPVNDLREHDEHRFCWCRPSLETYEYVDATVGTVVIHHALDGREHGEPDFEPMEYVQ